MHGATDLCIQFQLLQTNLIINYILFHNHFLSEIKIEVMHSGLSPFIQLEAQALFPCDVTKKWHCMHSKSVHCCRHLSIFILGCRPIRWAHSFQWLFRRVCCKLDTLLLKMCNRLEPCCKQSSTIIIFSCSVFKPIYFFK